MKQILFALSLLLTQQLFAQMPDSTAIKLRQYQDYYDRGLINNNEYQIMRAKTLQLNKPSKPIHYACYDSLKQYNQKLTFEVGIEPVAFFSVRYIEKYHGIDGNGQAYSGSQLAGVIPYGGMAVAIGAAYKKRYHAHILISYEGTPGEQIFMLGAGFSGNLLHGKVSPFIHVEGGYATGNSAEADSESPYNGCYTSAGVGLYVQVSKLCAITLSPDYRFIYGHTKQTSFYDNGIALNTSWQKVDSFNHQLGIRFAAIFY